MAASFKHLYRAVAIAGAMVATSPMVGATAFAEPSLRGSVEFTPLVNFTHQNFKREGYGNVDHFTQLNVTPTVGYYVSDHYEVTGGFLVRHESANGTDDTS